jgi:hypothetical protein
VFVCVFCAFVCMRVRVCKQSTYAR